MGVLDGLIRELARRSDARLRVWIDSKNRVKRGVPVNLVDRTVEPLSVARRWRRNGNELCGYFRTRFGSYAGSIRVLHQGMFQFFIWDPPDCLRRHSHFSCFLPRGENVYEVHFSLAPTRLDDGIFEIERLLTEAHLQHGRN